MSQPVHDPISKATDENSRIEVKNTTCYMCACRCGIRVTLRDGDIRYIQGNPEHPLNKGVICAKGCFWHHEAIFTRAFDQTVNAQTWQ